LLPGVAVGEALLAGFIAGYVMTLLGYWIEGFYGLPRMDLAQLGGMKYLGRDQPDILTWAVGIVTLYLNSAILGLLYAAAFYPNMPIENPTWWQGILFGLAYGVGIFIFLPGIILTALTRGQLMQMMPPRGLLASFLLHLAYGAVLGALYYPFG